MKKFYCVYIQNLDDLPEPYNTYTNKKDALNDAKILRDEAKNEGRKNFKVFVKSISKSHYDYLNS